MFATLASNRQGNAYRTNPPSVVPASQGLRNIPKPVQHTIAPRQSVFIDMVGGTDGRDLNFGLEIVIVINLTTVPNEFHAIMASKSMELLQQRQGRKPRRRFLR